MWVGVFFTSSFSFPYRHTLALTIYVNKFRVAIGAWSLAQAADVQSIEVSLRLCMEKHLMLSQIQNSTDGSLNITLVEYLVQINSNQSRQLLFCDRDNRAHSQYWLAYSYLQTGQYCKAIRVINDLKLSNNVSYPDKYYLPFAYIARTFVVTNLYFWLMHDQETHRENMILAVDRVLVEMDPNPIEMLGDNLSEGGYFVWSEASARLGRSMFFIPSIRYLDQSNITGEIMTSLSELHMSTVYLTFNRRNTSYFF